MKKILSALALLLIGSVANAQYVNWLDTLSYAKPRPVAISEPVVATGPQYWVDLTGGSGTTCSMASPCGDMDSVLGKSGINGGPAIIHLKGTGSMSWFNDTVQGTGDNDCRTASCTSWILITTWPAGSTGCATECTATITGNSNLNSATVNHLMWDGGPDLKIRFNSNGTGNYVQNINSNWHVIYRTQTFCTGANQQFGWQVGQTVVAAHVYFINNEFYGCAATGDQASSVYVGPGSGGGYSDFLFMNNLVRDFYGECIEINPRATSTGATIIGNVFHTCGHGTCADFNPADPKWNCRGAITMANQGPGAGSASTYIANNLMWDLASGCIWDRGGNGGGANPVIENNTCYDFGTGDGRGLDPNPEGIANINGTGSSATIRNNIFIPLNGTNPLGTGYANASFNACVSGESCGTSKVNFATTDFLSTSTSSLNFLKIGTSSPAKDAGTTPTTRIDYLGKTRPVNSLYDMGAIEYGTGGTSPPKAPVKQ